MLCILSNHFLEIPKESNIESTNMKERMQIVFQTLLSGLILKAHWCVTTYGSISPCLWKNIRKYNQEGQLLHECMELTDEWIYHHLYLYIHGAHISTVTRHVSSPPGDLVSATSRKKKKIIIGATLEAHGVVQISWKVVKLIRGIGLLHGKGTVVPNCDFWMLTLCPQPQRTGFSCNFLETHFHIQKKLTEPFCCVFIWSCPCAHFNGLWSRWKWDHMQCSEQHSSSGLPLDTCFTDPTRSPDRCEEYRHPHGRRRSVFCHPGNCGGGQQVEWTSVVYKLCRCWQTIWFCILKHLWQKKSRTYTCFTDVDRCADRMWNRYGFIDQRGPVASFLLHL